MDWNDLRHFLALARSGSVRAAGGELGVSHSTVARRVEALEARLSTRLFDRSRDGYALTEAGRQMLPRAELVEREMLALERGLVGRDERLAGPVALTCCDNHVARLVLGELAAFCALHPAIELSMVTDSRNFDLSRREADLAIRALGVGDQPPGYLIGRRVAPIMVCSYVAAAHAERLDPGCGATSTRWLGFERTEIQTYMLASSSYPEVPTWGAFASIELMIAAALEGLGMTMLPCYVGDAEPGLVRLVRPDRRHLGELWLLCHPDLRDNARIRATREAVAGVFERHAALFAGELSRMRTGPS